MSQQKIFETIINKIFYYMIDNKYRVDNFTYNSNQMICDYFTIFLNNKEKLIDVNFSFLNQQKETAVFSLLIYHHFLYEQPNNENIFINYKIRILDDIFFNKEKKYVIEKLGNNILH